MNQGNGGISDTIRVSVPMNITADLGVAMKRCREKRLRKMKALYPSLFPSHDNKNNGSQDSDDEEGSTIAATGDAASKAKIKEKKEFDDSIPQRDQYGSVLDYLEAKYVRGVMIPDLDSKIRSSGGSMSNGEGSDDDSSGGAGSCYSEASGFLDDSQLRTEVAEQVLASSQFGTTKIEAEGKKPEDDGFFVNVGDLEMAEGYDESEAQNIRFEEEEEGKKKKKKKKKKDKTKSESKDKDKDAAKRKRKRKDKDKEKKEDGNSRKKAKVLVASVAAPAGQHKSASSVSSSSKGKKKSVKDGELEKKVAGLKQRSNELKQVQLKLYKVVKKEIRKMSEDNLPRKEMTKVSITVPMNKRPGDDITFSNPRVPDQKLRVKIPSSTLPGGKFVVSVPGMCPSSPNVNNFSRDAKEALDDYSRAYDEWIEAEARYRENIPGVVYKPNNERLKKFDNLIHEFPDNLAVPIDAVFLRKVVRRARQNSSKRRKTIEMQANNGGVGGGGDAANREDGEGRVMKEKQKEKGPSRTLSLRVPGRGCVFGKIIFDKSQFER